MNPFFNIYIGPMFGSKTTRLLGDVDRLKHKGRKVAAFKPKMDARYDANKIASHNGGSVEAYSIERAEEIFGVLETYQFDTIAVDEAFMIPNIETVLIDFYRAGKNIIVSSIQLDAGEKPFERIERMLPFATKIEVCPAVCAVDGCDQDAYYTKALFDIDNATQEEKIGAKGMYEPRCFKHYFEDQQ